jgi:hypothetical protein
MTTKTKTEVPKITILEDGQIQVWEVIRVYNDDVLVGETKPHNRVVKPGDALDNEPKMVRDAISKYHTKKVVNQYKADREALIGG